MSPMRLTEGRKFGHDPDLKCVLGVVFCYQSANVTFFLVCVNAIQWGGRKNRRCGSGAHVGKWPQGESGQENPTKSSPTHSKKIKLVPQNENSKPTNTFQVNNKNTQARFKTKITPQKNKAHRIAKTFWRGEKTKISLRLQDHIPENKKNHTSNHAVWKLSLMCGVDHRASFVIVLGFVVSILCGLCANAI